MKRVIVVGAGVVGLSCAIRLQEAGHRVDVLARDRPLETTSAVAAAIWYPYRAYPVERVTGWSGATFEELSRLAADEDSGVRMVEGTELHRRRTPDPWWQSAVPGLVRVTAMPSPYVDGWTFRTPVVEMPIYLRWLVERFTGGGGTLTRMALTDLPGGDVVVVNAAGLGGRLLGGDPAVTPVRGQVVVLEQFGLDRWWLDGEGPTYVVPRSHDVVVGGSAEEGDWNHAVDQRTAAAILDRAARIVPEIAKARVLRHKVGLRPARPEVRLEVEQRGPTRIVHCYGHGGAGVTLSWGCADEVLSMVAD